MKAWLRVLVFDAGGLATVTNKLEGRLVQSRVLAVERSVHAPNSFNFNLG
jgi:hypothetical protein